MPEKKTTSTKKTTAKEPAAKQTVKKAAPPNSQAKKPGRIEAGIRKKAEKISGEDIDRLVSREQDIGEKLKQVPGKLRMLINQIRLLFMMLRDFKGGIYREVPWFSIAMSAVAILYFLNPMDFIPDWIIFAGFLDDAAMLALVFRALRDDLIKYCAFKGLDPKEYF